MKTCFCLFSGLRCGAAAASAGVLLIGTVGAAAAPAQSPLATSIARGAQAAVNRIRAEQRPALEVPVLHVTRLAIVRPDVEAAVTAETHAALAAIERDQLGRSAARVAVLWPAGATPASKRLARASSQRVPALGGMLAMLRALTQNAAFRWLPDVSLWIAAPPRLARVGHASGTF